MDGVTQVGPFFRLEVTMKIDIHSLRLNTYLPQQSKVCEGHFSAS